MTGVLSTEVDGSVIRIIYVSAGNFLRKINIYSREEYDPFRASSLDSTYFDQTLFYTHFVLVH